MSAAAVAAPVVASPDPAQHIGLAWAAARRYEHAGRVRGLTMEDLVAEGMLGVVLKPLPVNSDGEEWTIPATDGPVQYRTTRRRVEKRK